MKKQKAIFYILLCWLIFSAPAQNPEMGKQKNTDWSETDLSVKQEIQIFKKCYPDVSFELSWDEKVADWKITVGNYNKLQSYYWCDGKYLPYEEIKNKDKYWRVISRYENKVLDPAEFTPEMTERIREFSSNRKTGKVSSKFIFCGIYDDLTRLSTEQHIKQIPFLGRTVNAHEYLKTKLARVEKRILAESKKNPEVKKFLDELYSTEAYNWREIRDVKTRSFHSYGIAIDILPKMWGKKIVYWGFEKNNGNKDWMLIPLSKRWMPPKAVVDIFYDEGFIWGGTWAVWDNMHFEYHPELIEASKYKYR